MIGYGCDPDFEMNHPNGPLMEERIAYSMLHNTIFRDAFKREGIDADDQLLASLVQAGEKSRDQRVKLVHENPATQPGDMSRL